MGYWEIRDQTPRRICHQQTQVLSGTELTELFVEDLQTRYMATILDNPLDLAIRVL